MDATLDFLTENDQRRYPLDADCIVVPDPSGMDWPDGVLLDARGFWRGTGGSSFYLSRYRGFQFADLNSSGLTPGDAHLYFGRDPTGATWDFRIDVPGGLAATDFPVTLRAVVADPNPGYVLIPGTDENIPTPAPSYSAAGVLLGALEVTVGADIRLLPPDYGAYFGASAPLEPTCMIDLAGGQVDRIQGIRQLFPNFLVGAAASFVSGYNVDVRVLDQTVEIGARVGAGTLGTYVSAGTSSCGSVLRTLNGVGPDGRGRFSLRAGPGVRVDNFPDQHRIDVTLVTSALGADVCDPPTSS